VLEKEYEMTDKLSDYQRVQGHLPKKYRLWPLYGAGLENMGDNGQPIEVSMPSFGPDELLIRHDACGLCFSDTKVIAQGQNHPRITRDMKKEPIVLGHEVSMTVVGVGENLKDRYKIGDRLTLETDVLYKGVPLAYGYMLQGGLSQYSVIDRRVLESDDGNYLIPVNPERSYAEIALTEPWACVVAAYCLEYRTALKPGGTTWIIGAGDDKPYTIGAGFNAAAHPANLLLTNVPAKFDTWLRQCAEDLKIKVIDVPDVENPPREFVDDIVLLGNAPDLIEKVSQHLDQFGIMALMADKPMSRNVNIDVGRVHYHRWVYVGSTSNDIARAYSDVPVDPNLKPGGRTLIVGAGGPMGRMHVQRAIEFSNPPAVIVCSDVSDMRLNDLCLSFADEAQAKHINFICLNPTNKEAYTAGMAPFKQMGFDNVIVLAPIPAVISDASTWLSDKGVMNVFAGVARGTMVSLNMSDAYLRNTRIIGHSASLMRDMHLVLDKTEAGELSPNRSVEAVGSLSAARDGLKAVKDATLAGKVVIYPHIKEMPLTTLAELKDKMPSVYARLNNRHEWTKEAEEEFLRLMLPESN
jgi:D-arabinose 1-dehydrogenase-like Zn-dependent alcohol dehydrogenase